MDAFHLSAARASLTRRRLLQGAMAAGALIAASGCGSIRRLGAMPEPSPAALTTGPLTTLPVAALTFPPDITDQLNAFFTRLVQMKAFTGAVLVAQDDRVLLSQGYGWADQEQRIATVAATRLPIASLTKQFTAAGVLQLQDRGLLHVTDRIAAYLDVVPRAWRTITLQQLLVHTSGIPDYFELPGFAALSTQHPTPEQLIDLFRNAPLDFPPGSDWEYCDSDYVLLGHVIERVSGQKYGDYVREHICAPLGLAETGYAPGGGTPQATGYSAWGQLAPVDDPPTLYSCGGLVSSVGDLHRWHRALLTGTPQVASPAAIRSMFTWYAAANAPGGPDTGQGYGYGWMIDTAAKYRRYWHPGAIDGFVAYAAMYPDYGLSVIVLSNLETSDVRGAGETVAGMLL